MSGRFSTYESPNSLRYSTTLASVGGLASNEDELFVTKLLSTFVNKQSALFQRWIKVRISESKNNEYKKYLHSTTPSFGSKQPKSQLLVLTPLKIISLPTIQSPKRMKQFRIIDIVSLFVEENNNFTNYNNIGNMLSVGTTKRNKLIKPKKRTITNPKTNTPKIHIIKTKVINPSTLLYPKGSQTMSPKQYKKGKRNQNSKIIQSYTIIHHHKKPYNVQNQNGRHQQQKIQPNSLSSNVSTKSSKGIKILRNDNNGRHRHHVTKSSSSMSHSLSPPPSTSFEQPSFNDYCATDDDYMAEITRSAPLLETREPSKSHSGSFRSKSKTYESSINSLGGYNSWLYHCCIKFHKLDVLEMSYDQLSSYHKLNNGVNTSSYIDTDTLHIYFESADVAQEFLDILQFYLFTLYRGVPIEYKPKVEIIPNILAGEYVDGALSSDDEMKSNKPNTRSPKRKTKYPFVPSQVFIDRYVAYCDAQRIPALDSVIDYVIHTNDNDIFDVAAAFSHHLVSQRHHTLAFSDENPPYNRPILSGQYSLASEGNGYGSNGGGKTKNIQLNVIIVSNDHSY